MGNFFTFESLGQYPELIHGVSTSSYGNLSYKWAEANAQNPNDVRTNRQRFFADMGVDETGTVPTQVEHRDRIWVLTKDNCGKGVTDPEQGLTGDGFITNIPGVFPCILTGDCLALFFFDQVKGAVGLAHAGWAGVDQELPKKMVMAMSKEYGCNPGDLRVGLGPALAKEYSVINELGRDFNQERTERWQPYTTTLPSKKLQINWVQFAIDQLVSAGVLLERVEDSGIDTYSDPRFYSHRRSVQQTVPEARFASLIGLR